VIIKSFEENLILAFNIAQHSNCIIIYILFNERVMTATTYKEETGTTSASE
jgi:hypothetical protein